MPNRKILLPVLLLLGILAAVFPAPGQEGPSPSKRQADFALGLYQRGDHREALREFEVYLKNRDWKDERPVCLFFAAECHRQLGEPAQAANKYELLLEFAPDSEYTPIGRYRLAEIQLENREGEIALRTLEPFLQKEIPTELREGVLYSLAVAYSLTGKTDLAIEKWKQVRTDFPDSDSARRSLFGMAVETFRAQKWEESVGLLEEWLKLPGSVDNSAYPEALQRLAEAESELGRTDKALEAFLSLSESAGSAALKQNALVEAARLAFEGDKKEVFDRLAVRAETELTESLPRMKWHLLAGNRDYRDNRWNQARVHYQSSLEWAQKSGFQSDQEKADLLNQVSLRLAWCDVALSDWKQVGPHLEKVTGPARTSDEYSYLMGESLRQQAEWKAAYDSFSKVPLTSKHFTLAEKGRADAAFRGAMWVEAASAYTQLTQKTEEADPKVFYLLRAAEAERKQEAWGKSAVMCATAALLTASPAVREKALYLGGWSYLRAGQSREALLTLRQFVNDFPHSSQLSNALYMLAQATNLLGDRADEAKVLERLVTDFPDSPWTADGLLRLAGAYSFLDQREGILSALLRFQRKFPDKPLNEDYGLWLAEELVEGASYSEALLTLTGLAGRDLQPAQKERSLLLSGLSEEGLENWDRALQDFQAALEAFPQGDHYLALELGAGRSAYFLGDFPTSWDHVRSALDRASGQTSNDPEVEAQLFLLAGDLAYAEGDYELAYRNYARPSILLRHPRWTPMALYKSALAKDRLGDEPGARSLREELAADFPDFKPEEAIK